MAANSADYWTKVGSPGTATTLSAPGHLIGGTSITVVSTANHPTDTGYVFAMDMVTLVNGEEVRNVGTYTEWEAVVSGATSITTMVLKKGTDQDYPAGATTRVYIPVAASQNDIMVDGLLVQHKQTGSHADTITTNTINENTAANGVTIDGLNIKDGKLNTDDSVVAANLTDGIVANVHLNTTAGDIGGPWLDWTPDITSSGGTATTVNTTTARYTLTGQTLTLTVGITIVAKGTATGALSFTLPQTGKNIGAGGGVEISATGQALAVESNTTGANVKYYNNTTVWGDGAVLRIHLTYEMA